MLQKNIVKNDTMCDMQRYVYKVKLQNFERPSYNVFGGMLNLARSIYDNIITDVVSFELFKFTMLHTLNVLTP